MNKFSIALSCALICQSVVYSASAAPTETQQWECAADLHQGDRGTLSINRVGDDVSGNLSIKRNDSVFDDEISGRWTNSEINIKRLLGDSTNEPMVGTVIALGTKKVKMGGRFSAQYQGVWSADCDLVSSSSAAESKPNDESATSVEPSTSVGVIPNQPTSRERVKFSARASHPDGIESVTFFLGNNKIHSCDTAVCDFSHRPLAKGKYSWRVEAISKSGVKNTEQANELLVRAAPATGLCSISGEATGTAAELSGIYLIRLFGPNSATLRTSKEFSEGSYKFSNLPEGTYTLSVDTRADRGVLATPSATTAKCLASGNVTVNFDFR